MNDDENDDWSPGRSDGERGVGFIVREGRRPEGDRAVAIVGGGRVAGVVGYQRHAAYTL